MALLIRVESFETPPLFQLIRARNGNRHQRQVPQWPIGGRYMDLTGSVEGAYFKPQIEISCPRTLESAQSNRQA